MSWKINNFINFLFKFNASKTYEVTCQSNIHDSISQMFVTNELNGIRNLTDDKYTPMRGDLLLTCKTFSPHDDSFQLSESVKINEVLFDPIFINETESEDNHVITYCANPKPSYILLEENHR